MKKTIILSLFLLTGIVAYAASHTMSLTNLVGDSKISGDFIDLSGNTMLVDQYHDGSMLLLYQKQKAEAMLYTSIDQELRWKKDNMGGIFQMTSRGLLNSNNTDRPVNGNVGFFTSLDDLSGNHVWTRNILPVYVDDSADVVLGYHARWNSFNGDVEFNSDNVLCAYRLSDGQKLWQDTITHYTRWGWNNVMYMPESGNYLVWTDKLMIINPQTGVEKSMVVNTGRYGVPIGVSKRDRRTDHGSNADYAFTPYVDRGYWTGIKSNVIFKDGMIYLADEESLYCLSDNLDVIWFSQLPKDKTSAMHISIDEDRITLLSSGLAYLEGCSYPVGKSFVAEFNLENGKEIFYNNINIDGKIKDAYLGNGKAFFLTSNGLSVVDDFQEPLVKNYGKDVVGKVNEIGNKAMYVLADNKMIPMGTRGNDLLLVGKDGIDREFDGDAEKVAKTAVKDSLYDHYGNDVYVCFGRDKKGNIDTDEPGDLIIAKNGNKVSAHFNTEFSSAFYDDGLLTIVMNDGIFSTKL